MKWEGGRREGGRKGDANHSVDFVDGEADVGRLEAHAFVRSDDLLVVDALVEVVPLHRLSSFLREAGGGRLKDSANCT